MSEEDRMDKRGNSRQTFAVQKNGTESKKGRLLIKKLIGLLPFALLLKYFQH